MAETCIIFIFCLLGPVCRLSGSPCCLAASLVGGLNDAAVMFSSSSGRFPLQILPAIQIHVVSCIHVSKSTLICFLIDYPEYAITLCPLLPRSWHPVLHKWLEGDVHKSVSFVMLEVKKQTNKQNSFWNNCEFFKCAIGDEFHLCNNSEKHPSTIPVKLGVEVKSWTINYIVVSLCWKISSESLSINIFTSWMANIPAFPPSIIFTAVTTKTQLKGYAN